MKNCEVNKLLGTVNNDSLRKLNIWPAVVKTNHAASSSYGAIIVPSGKVVRFLDEEGNVLNTFTGNGSGQPFDFADAMIGKTIQIENYYAIIKLGGGFLQYDISMYEYNQLTGSRNIVDKYSYGQIESLYRNTGLTDLSVGGSVQGELGDLAKLMVSEGRNSGAMTVYVNGYGTNVTCNGVRFQDSTKTIKFGSSMVDPTAEETAQGYQLT